MGIQLFDVVLRCDARGLSKVLEHTNSSGTGVQLINLLPVREEQPSQPTLMANALEKERLNKRMHYVGGKRNKGITGRNLALQLLRSENRMFYANELVEAFANKGFAGNSLWAVLSVLVKEGLVRKVGDGRYAAAGTTINLGAGSALENA